MNQAKRTPETENLKSRLSPVVLTVGHSTRPLEDFIGLLQHYSVQMVIDLRTVPRSRHNPQFNRETLPGRLESAGIKYIHMSGLGGLRHPRPDSTNTGWRNASFRGFADYMGTDDFEKNLEDVIRLSRRERIALMCAETLPWRCHRSLVADALVIRGMRVEHILSLNHHQPHSLTPFAKVQGTRVIYPPQEIEESEDADNTEGNG
jgi:uncharacterized protein (DUF488 family)